MIELRNLRLERGPEWSKLIVDITAERDILPDDTMWFALPNEYADMFDMESYDPFLLVPYYMGMFWGQDVRVHGKASKLFYKNLTSGIGQIFDGFSDHTQKVRLTVDGFCKVAQAGSIVGASGSCGVDSLCTIYDHYGKESDPEYRVNALFLFNCGTHGGFDEKARKLWLDRLTLNRRAAKELDLPLYPVDSNLHRFTYSMYRSNEPIGYLSIYSCILCLQKAIRKYYISGDFTFQQTLQLNESRRDFDLSEYAAPMLVPLIRTEIAELILDQQYSRAEKLAHIADWDIAQKYINVCVRPLKDGSNCTVNCPKCRGAMLILEALGKTGNFRKAFDVDLFHRRIKKMKIRTMARYYNDPLFARDTVDFVKARGMKMPSFPYAALRNSPRKIKHLIKERRERKYDRRI